MVLLTIRSAVARELDTTVAMARHAFERRITAIADISSMQLLLIIELRKRKTMSIDEAQSYIGLSSDEFIDLITPLIDQSRIVMPSDMQDGRLTLTSYGAETLSHMEQAVTDAEAQVLRGFSEEERQTLLSFLSRMQTNCSINPPY